MCRSLSTKLQTTTWCHVQTNGQTEKYSRGIASGLRYYVSEHEVTWDAFIQQLTYVYNSAHSQTMEASVWYEPPNNKKWSLNAMHFSEKKHPTELQIIFVRRNETNQKHVSKTVQRSKVATMYEQLRSVAVCTQSFSSWKNAILCVHIR